MSCGEKGSLQAHHLTYKDIGTCFPWDYEDYELITVCSSCHNTIHFSKNWREDQWKFFPEEVHNRFLEKSN